MKQPVTSFILMIVASLVVFSFTFSVKPVTINSGPFGPGVWDLADLNERTVDSSTSPYTITTFDTLYASHSQCSYQFINGGLSGDSLIYKNYSATPAIVKTGYVNLISNNKVVILITPGHSDTLNYTVSLPENTLYFTRVVNTPHQSQTFVELYSVR